MADEVIDKTQENGTAPAEKSPETDPAEKKEPTMAEINKGAEPEPKGDDKETVGLPKYMEEKKKRQNLEKELADLKKQMDGGASKKEVTQSLADLAKEYEDVDPVFLQKLTGVIRSELKKDYDLELDEKLKPLQESAQEKKINEVFTTHFDRAMANMPEYKNIVDPNVIKTLSLDPANEDKTFAQIIEETYGKFVTGKKTMEEKTTPGGGKEPESIDYAKAKKDPAYFKTIMASPRLKAEYNKGLENRIGS